MSTLQLSLQLWSADSTSQIGHGEDPRWAFGTNTVLLTASWAEGLPFHYAHEHGKSTLDSFVFGVGVVLRSVMLCLIISPPSSLLTTWMGHQSD